MAVQVKRPRTAEEIILTFLESQLKEGETWEDYTFRATEKRLYGYPIAKARVENFREKIKEIEEGGLPGRSNIPRIDQVLAQKGSRLDPEEIKETILTFTSAQMQIDEREIREIDIALRLINGSHYTDIIRYKYFEEKSDEQIADLICCDDSTVRRNKNILVRRIALFLYGSAAI